jgi:hypothetical protein
LLFPKKPSGMRLAAFFMGGAAWRGPVQALTALYQPGARRAVDLRAQCTLLK